MYFCFPVEGVLSRHGSGDMKEAKFVARNREKWARMEKEVHTTDADRLATDFVELSEDLSYARTFYPGSDTESYLNHLIAGYQVHIYRYRPEQKRHPLGLWTTELPLLLYRRRKTFLFAFLFFVFSCLLGWFSAGHEDSFVRLILGDAYVNQTLDNIAEGKPMGVYASTDAWTMFWTITLNNIRVAFIAFVFGIFFSAGSLWILFQNGIMLGAFQYFFYGHNLFVHSVLSVWAHGTFEITSIVIAGGAGLMLGNGFLFPGTYGRLLSFRRGAMEGIKVVTGLIPFFVIAGFIESFITRYADAAPVVGGGMIVLSLAGVIGYFVVYPCRVNRERNKLTENGTD